MLREVENGNITHQRSSVISRGHSMARRKHNWYLISSNSLSFSVWSLFCLFFLFSCLSIRTWLWELLPRGLWSWKSLGDPIQPSDFKQEMQERDIGEVEEWRGRRGFEIGCWQGGEKGVMEGRTWKAVRERTDQSVASRRLKQGCTFWVFIYIRIETCGDDFIF